MVCENVAHGQKIGPKYDLNPTLTSTKLDVYFISHFRKKLLYTGEVII